MVSNARSTSLPSLGLHNLRRGGVKEGVRTVIWWAGRSFPFSFPTRLTVLDPVVSVFGVSVDGRVCGV